MIAFLFSGNVFNLIGVSLVGAVTASLWQPSQPVFTMISAALLGTEKVTFARSAGILLTVGGCAVMVAGSAKADAHGGHGHGAVMGNVFLLLNCLSTPLYIIASKPLVQRGYPPLLLAGTCFSCNTCL